MAGPHNRAVKKVFPWSKHRIVNFYEPNAAKRAFFLRSDGEEAAHPRQRRQLYIFFKVYHDVLILSKLY